jgi:hypothetical protein
VGKDEGVVFLGIQGKAARIGFEQINPSTSHSGPTVTRAFPRRHPRSNPPKAVKPNALGSGTGEGENWMSSIIQRLLPLSAGALNINCSLWPSKAEEILPPYKKV